MSYHPLNLIFRFILELSALVSLAYWGWTNFEGYTRYIMTGILPLTFIIIWGVFAVKGDKSRSGKTVISTPGYIRLALELILFGLSIWALKATGNDTISLIFLSGVILHYLLSMERIKWLMRKDK